jgi:hypothetical protein
MAPGVTCYTNPLYVGPGDTSAGDFFQYGTGNLRFTMGGAASIWPFRDSAGSQIFVLTGGTPDLITTKTTIQLQPPGVLSGASPLGFTSLLMNSAYSGTTSNGGITTLGASFSVSSEAVGIPQPSPSAKLELVTAGLTSGGAGMHGNRAVGDFSFTLTQPSGNAGNFYVGVVAACSFQSADNGTAPSSGNASGNCFGINPKVSATGTATAIAQIVGDETDIEADNGTSLLDKIGIQIVQPAADKVQGSRDDVALSINNQAGSAGWKVGLEFGRGGGASPCGSILTTCTLIGAQGNNGASFNATSGVDFSLVNFTGSAFKSPGFSVDGSGNIDVSHSLVMTDPYGVGDSVFRWIGGVSGTCNNGSSGCAVFEHVFNSSGVNKVGVGPDLIWDDYRGNYGGAGLIGTAYGINVAMTFTGPSGNTGGSNYVGLSSTMTTGSNDNGTSGTPASNLFATNFTCRIGSGATFWKGCVGEEIDMAVEGTGSAQFLNGLQIVLLNTNTVVPSVQADAIVVSEQGSATAQFTTGLDFSGYNGYLAIQPTGTLIGCNPHSGTGNCNRWASTYVGTENQVTNGIDFSLLAFTGSAFKSPGFIVNGSGSITTGSGSSTNDFTQGGTGNLRFHMGGPTSIWNFLDSAGVSMFQLAGGAPDVIYTKVTLNPQVGLILSGTGNLGNAAIFMNNTYSGTFAGNGLLGLFGFAQATENVNMSGTLAQSALEMLNLNLISGGAATYGNRHVAEFDFTLSATSNNTFSGGAFYTALNTKCNINVNDNGTTGLGNGKGFCFALNPSASLGASATFINQLVGEELDVNAAAGSSVTDKIGMQVVEGTNVTDAIQGSRDDVALSFNSGGTGASFPAGWKYVIMFGRNGGYSPCNPVSCTLMYATDHGGVMSATNGIDFSNASFTGSAFKSPGFSVDGSGAISGVRYNATQAPFTMSGSWAGSSAPVNAVFYWTGGVNGTCNNSNQPCGLVNIVTNNMNVASTGSEPISAVNIQGNVGGSALTQGVVYLNANLTVNAASAANGISKPYNAGSFVARASVNDGGATGTNNGKGAAFGSNPVARLLNGATFWSTEVGEEVDISTATGASVEHQAGIQVVLLGDNAVTPSLGDSSGLILSAQPSAASTLAYGINLSGYRGYMPITASGTILGCSPHNGSGNCNNFSGSNSVANGVDFSLLAFTGSAFKSPGFSVDGSGNVTVNTTQTAGFTVSGLPAAGAAGRRAYVTDQLTSCPAVGGTLTGGGAVKCPVFDNGTAWVSG